MINEIAPNLFPTLNKFGLMTTKFDVYTEMFINHAIFLSNGHVAELGGAYGAVTEKILKLNNNIKLTINDLDKRHLEVLTNKIGTRSNLNVVIGRIPDEVDFPANSFDAVLAARVLQYLHPNELLVTLKNIYKWLKPNRKLYIVCKTLNL